MTRDNGTVGAAIVLQEDNVSFSEWSQSGVPQCTKDGERGTG